MAVPRRRSTLVDEFVGLADRKELEAFASLSCRQRAGGLIYIRRDDPADE